MTTRKVRNDAVAAGIGFVAGLLVLLVWRNRESTNQLVVFTVALGISALMSVAIGWLVLNERPQFDFLAFVTQTGPPRLAARPRRYSIPDILALATGLTVAGWLQSTGVRDWALTAFIVLSLLIIAGATASGLWWAHASKSRSRDIPAG
jgi:hypothetical protein